MSTDDLHRIRRVLRDLNEDRHDRDDRGGLELGRDLEELMKIVLHEWAVYSEYIKDIHGRAAIFTTPNASRVLMQFLIERRTQIQSYMRAHQEDVGKVDETDIEDLQELITETRGLIKMVRDLKALTFILADIDNDFKLSPSGQDDESKRQLHQNAWAHEVMRDMAAKGVPFNMAA